VFCVPYVASVSGLSIFDCPFGFFFNIYYSTVISNISAFSSFAGRPTWNLNNTTCIIYRPGFFLLFNGKYIC
jgi:hypothetical protein